jgi:uncharacterized phiE125 gp8 family phage protein
MWYWPNRQGLHVAAVRIDGPDNEPLTVEELKDRGRIDRTDEDNLLVDYLVAAREQVEADTDHAIGTQTWQVRLEPLPLVGYALELPWPPLQAVLEIRAFDLYGDDVVLDPATYRVDAISRPGRLLLLPSVVVGTGRGAAGLVLTLTAGFTEDTLPARLKQAIGLLAAHMAGPGRDLVQTGTRANAMPFVPYGYAELIAPFQRVGVT